MASAPGLEFLPTYEQQQFANEFQKEVQFFEFLILMLSKSLPTGSVDITWMDGHDGLRQVLGTTQAAKAACSRYLHWDRQDPNQRFCNVVSDHGDRAAESCAVCENAAEKRVGTSGCTQVYRCHAGLTDIAVPVIADGRHIATLYSGQVLTESPSQEGFQRVLQDVHHLTYIDANELKKAYWQVPVVSEEDIKNTVGILEVFAGYLSRFWKRIGDSVSIERQKLRASQLAAKEFAYMILRAESENRSRLLQLMKQLGFIQPPNRAIVITLKPEEELDASLGSFDVVLTRVLQVVEEITEKTQNAAVAYLQSHGVCVFFRELTEGISAGARGRLLADRILREITDRCAAEIRIGIGGVKAGWYQIAESYHEACLALASSSGVIAVCGSAKASLPELSAQIEIACNHLANQRVPDAYATLRTLPLLANRCLGTNSLPDHRNFFSSALESIYSTAIKAGCDKESIARTRREGQAELAKAATLFDVQSIFLEVSQTAGEEVGRLLIGKHEKVIARVQQMLEQRLKQGHDVESFSLTEAARALGISTGHLSRTFRKMTNMTFREYTLTRRIEHGCRLLLDPLNNVSGVSERCGFSSPAYFARVFRRFSGCAPTEYARNPRVLSEQTTHSHETTAPYFYSNHSPALPVMIASPTYDSHAPGNTISQT
jgi:AraC-like DNA-binding protein/ligand-binding sensor protein